MSAEETPANWQVLFDGTSTNAFRGWDSDHFPSKGWTIENGSLKCEKTNGRPNGGGGDIVTKETFDNFELRWEWKIGKNGNSGVKYFVRKRNHFAKGQELFGGDDGQSLVGHEYQMLDDANHPDAKNGSVRRTSSFYQIIAAENVKLKSLDDFNESRLLVDGNHVEHWLNGVKVLEYKLGSHNILERVEQSKYRFIDDFGKKLTAPILFQDHGDELWLRNIRIRRIAPHPRSTAAADSPYGVCAHLAGGTEHNQMPQNLRRMREAGITHVRADFSWGSVERPHGTWRYEHLDRVVQQAEKEGVEVLPILNYDVSWATPAFKYLPEWKNYVRNVVSRYKDKIRYWEVWNEPDLKGFWKDEPSGKNYATLLMATYETIKEIDPELVVVYGGLSGVPFKFFEESLQQGAGNSFDIINIHPYRGGLTSILKTEKLVADIEQFRTLLQKYKIAPKPIWITEMGWATLPTLGEDNRRMITGAMAILFPNGISGSVAFLVDPLYEPSQSWGTSRYVSALPTGTTIETVTLAELKNLDPTRQQVLILPPSESFPSAFFEHLVRYVKTGGTLVLTGGVPLYYLTKEEQGTWTQGGGASESFRKQLRIGWKAWWTDKTNATPQETPLQLSSEVAASLPNYVPAAKGTRFLTDTALQSGDKLIPLFISKNGDFDGIAACIYRFDSDFRGAVVVSTIPEGAGLNISSEEEQGIFLPQSYLISFAAGVERYYWYEFQSPEVDKNDKESFFGLTHRDLSPKPGYIAYQTLTRARPSGSVQGTKWQNGDVCVVNWTRPDGKTGWAIWSPLVSQEMDIEIQGDVDEAFDYLGEPVDSVPKHGKITISNKILYLIGPQRVTVK